MSYQLPCIPAEFVAFARGWYSGSSSMLYAIASTGGLTRGTRMPFHCSSEWEWDRHLWDALRAELLDVRDGLARSPYGYDLDELEEVCLPFLAFVNAVIDALDSVAS